MTAIHYDRVSGRVLGAWLDAQRPPSAADIARRAGCSRQFVAKILKGDARPTADVIRACQELGVPVDRLVGVDESAKAVAS
jgi:transcriptional regulator with XRE-family HTH domain